MKLHLSMTIRHIEATDFSVGTLEKLQDMFELIPKNF